MQLPQESEAPAAVEEPAIETAAPAVMDQAGLDLLFEQARTHNAWTSTPVSHAELRALYDLLRMGPTSANCSPARFVFLHSQHAKQRLLPALSAGNIDKTMTAPVVAIVGHDPRFYDQLPYLFPHADARPWFTSSTALAEETAFRNGTLQGAYLIMAARSLGLDCGPMSGFDKAIVDRDILGDYGWKSNFLVNIGHGDPAGVFPRSPRLAFEQACIVL